MLQSKVIAVLTASPALSSILSAVLTTVPGLKVRSFESEVALIGYMRFEPVDLVVCDFDCERTPADALVRELRGDRQLVRRNFQAIALASTIRQDMRAIAAEIGIDEIIVKPMSPKYLLERVQGRLKDPSRRPQPRLRLVQSKAPREIVYRDNVVPLFPNGRPTQPTV
jgi:DNA-binding response OmpR family regulator